MSFFKKLFSGNDANLNNKTTDFSEGDIFYTQSGTSYNIYKLLVIDTEFECYHILVFSPLNSLPTIASIDNLPISVYHSPFDKKAFAGATLLTNKTVTSADLVGYHEYLRQTQDANFYVPIANNYYKSGLRLTDEKKHFEAIDAYSKAIDLFPQFFEAIDNRAFCKMDVGLWIDAIEDFKLSLEQNPNSLLAEFSIGECYFKMGDFKKFLRSHISLTLTTRLQDNF
jgi:tetratricopeptide (TPR) repeat protein